MNFDKEKIEGILKFYFFHKKSQNLIIIIIIIIIIITISARAEGLFDRTLLYGDELSPFFPSQTLTIVFYERVLPSMMMMIILQ